MTSADPPLPPVTWPNTAWGCAASVGGGCGAQVCVAQPLGFDDLCIFQPGDHLCPGEPYTTRYLIERISSDTRGCSAPCTCSASASCQGTIELFDQTNCEGNALQAQEALCVEGSVRSVRYTPAVTGSCSPAVRNPTGAVEFEQTTVCCRS